MTERDIRMCLTPSTRAASRAWPSPLRPRGSGRLPARSRPQPPLQARRDPLAVGASPTPPWVRAPERVSHWRGQYIVDKVSEHDEAARVADWLRLAIPFCLLYAQADRTRWAGLGSVARWPSDAVHLLSVMGVAAARSRGATGGRDDTAHDLPSASAGDTGPQRTGPRTAGPRQQLVDWHRGASIRACPTAVWVVIADPDRGYGPAAGRG